MFVTIMLLLLGLVLLFAGGDALVRGGVSLAGRLGLSPLIIGLTVVGFGTSTPELLVSVEAALAGSPDIAVGNIVGSNSANILLILGVSACIAPMVCKMTVLSRDLVVMIAAAVVMLALGYYGIISRWLGVAMLATLAVYLIHVARTASADELPAGLRVVPMKGWKEAGAIAGGLLALMTGANFLVESSTIIARAFGVSEAVIGLTIVAIGTSLPELATSVIAAYRRQSEVAIGNVIGSNIFNIMGILGVTAIVRPVTIAPEFAAIDIPLMLAISMALALVVFWRGAIGRATGLLFLASYSAYLIYLF